MKSPGNELDFLKCTTELPVFVLCTISSPIYSDDWGDGMMKSYLEQPPYPQFKNMALHPNIGFLGKKWHDCCTTENMVWGWCKSLDTWYFKLVLDWQKGDSQWHNIREFLITGLLWMKPNVASYLDGQVKDWFVFVLVWHMQRTNFLTNCLLFMIKYVSNNSMSGICLPNISTICHLLDGQ